MIDLRANPFFLEEEQIEWVQTTLAGMTLEEKIGQLFVPTGFGVDPANAERDLLGYHIGGMVYGRRDARATRDLYDRLQRASKIPLLIAANLEAGGDGVITDGTPFGKQMQAAATRDPENAYRLGKVSCAEGAAVGCNWAFAPVVDIDRNWRNPITNVRTYGDDPDFVLACGRAYLRAAKEENVLVSIKHFPGDGCDEVDQHILTSVNDLSCEEWDATYGKIYAGLIADGAQTVMVGHIAQPAYEKFFHPDAPDKLVPATLSPALIQGLLRGKLGFNGLIVTDSTCMVGFSSAMCRRDAVPYTIEAGCDMFLFNKNLGEDFRYMMEGYHSGALSETRLNEAVTRILAVKASLGLHRKAGSERVPGPEALAVVGCETHKQWARECAQQAVTLVKHKQDVLPLNPAKTPKILLEVLGHASSCPRVGETLKRCLEREGFQVEIYEKEVFRETRFDVELFRAKYDLVIYAANLENASNQVTNRLEWYTFFGNGNNVPWFVEERPTIFISFANPYHLVDVPMMKTYINAYSNHDAMIETVVDKLMGRGEWTGTSPCDAFCGKEYLKW